MHYIMERGFPHIKYKSSHPTFMKDMGETDLQDV
jgi:hypothetical protein